MKTELKISSLSLNKFELTNHMSSYIVYHIQHSGLVNPKNVYQRFRIKMKKVCSKPNQIRSTGWSRVSQVPASSFGSRPRPRPPSPIPSRWSRRLNKTHFPTCWTGHLAAPPWSNCNSPTGFSPCSSLPRRNFRRRRARFRSLGRSTRPARPEWFGIPECASVCHSPRAPRFDIDRDATNFSISTAQWLTHITYTV